MRTRIKIFAIAPLLLALSPFGNDAAAFDPASNKYWRFQPQIASRNCTMFVHSFVVTGARCNDGYDSAARQLRIKPGTVRVGWSLYPSLSERQQVVHEKDRVKKEWAESKGFKVLSFWESDIRNRIDVVLSEVKNAIL